VAIVAKTLFGHDEGNNRWTFECFGFLKNRFTLYHWRRNLAKKPEEG
jgi:hypothetical protein